MLARRRKWRRPWQPITTIAGLHSWTRFPTLAEAERLARLTWEAKGTAEAHAQFKAGFYVDAADIDAWIDGIGTDHETDEEKKQRKLTQMSADERKW
jgi:hypothetical protein